MPPSLKTTALITLAACGFALFATTAAARIGETQEAVERRLLQPGLGKIHRPDAPENTKNAHKPKGTSAAAIQKEKIFREKFREREQQKQPFTMMRRHLPPDIREVTYWKSASTKQLDTENGWAVHVFYWKNRSVLEAYERKGETLNEFEIKGILLLNRGNSNWTEKNAVSISRKNTPATDIADDDNPPPNTGTQPSFLGYDYELADRSLRVKVKGNWLYIYSSRFDTYLWNQDALLKEAKRREAEAKRLIDAQKAPESITGF